MNTIGFEGQDRSEGESVMQLLLARWRFRCGRVLDPYLSLFSPGNLSSDWTTANCPVAIGTLITSRPF